MYYDLAPADAPKTTEPALWVECAQRARNGGFKAMKIDRELYGMDTLCHNMCSPVGTYAQAHACATIHQFVAMENACADDVIQHEGPLYQDGYLLLNDKSGLGIELNEDYCRKHLSKGTTFFGS